MAEMISDSLILIVIWLSVMTLTRVYSEKEQLGQKEIQLYGVRRKRVPSFVLKEVGEGRRE